MPILPNAQNLTITGGKFTDNSTLTTTTFNLNGPTGIDTLLEASCPEAALDASARSYPPRCFPGTREQYIQDIVNWAIPTLGNAPTPIYWMKGPAGVGKSSVAQTCAEELKERDKLGAAFFFSINGQNKPAKFFPSIAYQLSTIHPPYRDLIDGKIRHDKTLVDKAMSFQFRYLIDKPLRELEAQGKGIGKRTVIIVDGLDECEETDAQREIIHIVTGAASDGKFPLCWAFFSRPEPHIEATFASTTIAPHCHVVILPISRDADGEIELYLRTGFENILKRHNATTQSHWPSIEDIKMLVGAAGGLFIYATTLIRFVDHLGSLGFEKRLRAIIDIILGRRKLSDPSASKADTPFSELDAFYKLILERIPTEVFATVHLLLALLCQWGGYLGAMLGANILGLSKGEFEAICNHTSAGVHFQYPGRGFEFDPTIDVSCTYMETNQDVLMQLDPPVRWDLGGRLSFYHKSFYDFLLDPARSGSYCVKDSEALAKHYLKLQLDYDQSYHWEKSKLVLAPGVTDSASTLSWPYTNELVNSLIKAHIYIETGIDDSKSFSALRSCGFAAMGTNQDFRKTLHVTTYLGSVTYSLPYSSAVWGCKCLSRSYPGTQICWIPLAEFNVDEFKLMVKQRKQAKVIQRYPPKWPSRVKSFFRDKPQEHFDSALYRMGHNEKSVFWYWEINYKLGYYRSFEAINLAEGEKIFREEDFALWPHQPGSE